MKMLLSLAFTLSLLIAVCVNFSTASPEYEPGDYLNGPFTDWVSVILKKHKAKEGECPRYEAKVIQIPGLGDCWIKKSDKYAHCPDVLCPDRPGTCRPANLKKMKIQIECELPTKCLCDDIDPK